VLKVNVMLAIVLCAVIGLAASLMADRRQA